jgi:hypothetical protein
MDRVPVSTPTRRFTNNQFIQQQIPKSGKHNTEGE